MIRLANGLPLPKAGVIAELEGARVAAAIAAQLQEASEPAPFSGDGMCFIETGHGTAALVDGHFFAEPEPDVRVRPPSAEIAAAKRVVRVGPADELVRQLSKPHVDHTRSRFCLDAVARMRGPIGRLRCRFTQHNSALTQPIMVVRGDTDGSRTSPA